ncbi:MAG: AAA family ATPase, partial [Actinomycetota bacterium]|nr:AAA family ATPase [Actinomycetota bacterium]
MSTPVLETKLFAPTRRAKLVARPRLIRQLDLTLEAGHRLTLVAAPAGFGKTTVLTDWIADLAARRPPPRVAWLSLDGDDDDLTRLLTHLVAALGRVGIDIAPSVLEAMPGSSTPAVLTVLVNELSRAGARAAGQQWVLVLD